LDWAKNAWDSFASDPWEFAKDIVWSGAENVAGFLDEVKNNRAGSLIYDVLFPLQKIAPKLVSDFLPDDVFKFIGKAVEPISDSMFGFEYDESRGLFHTRREPVPHQYHFGFGDAYDTISSGPFLGMDIDNAPVVFQYGDKEYLFELWKGQYGWGVSTGGEIGIYSRDITKDMEEYKKGEENYGVFYDSASKDEWLNMTFTIAQKSTGKEIFTLSTDDYVDPGEAAEDFWLLGMQYGTYIDRNDVIMKNARIQFQNEGMARAFADALLGDTQTSKGKGVDVRNLSVNGLIVTFDWWGDVR
jgi:hypothetical protein